MAISATQGAGGKAAARPMTPEERKVIPGLYAAGRTACGLPRWGKGYSSGMSIADSTFFGRQAGRQAACAAPAGG